MSPPTTGEVRAFGAVTFLEGPAADEAGHVYVSDIIGNRILRLSAEGQVDVLRDPSGRANGSVLTRAGYLYTCEGGEMGPGGGRRIVRTHVETGVTQVLTERFDGCRYNSPNDLTVGADGSVWFTDPRYGGRDDLEMDVEGVYRIGPDGTVSRVMGNDVVRRPNGIALSVDGSALYVVDSHPGVGVSRRILRARVRADGTLGDAEVIIDFGLARGGDGLKVDAADRLYICSGIATPRNEGETGELEPAVRVYEPDGRYVTEHPIPQDVVTNCCFGGPDGRTLFVTAGHTVFCVQVDVEGHRV